ncbi:MAG: hypothetical protein Athens071425_473 [Parcubacteria group bacterium Athens0714_25]|nr:MAG: hypothetical protein Athens071425_473 [Parcubacteria group bacterium Athens0714_25]
MIKLEKRTLANGLKVIVSPMENTETVTILVLVGVGSRFETKNINGISHFLEHLFFKGTKNRPNPGDVHKELDRIGAMHNAFTGKENTGFWVKSSAKDFDTSLDIVSDILLEPLFKQEEIEKERGVILQEISMYEDDPRRRIMDILENVLYGDQPIGWDIIGSKENVRAIKRNDIVNYKDKNYLSQNMIVVVAGNINPQTTFKKVEKIFSQIKKGKVRKPSLTKELQKFPQFKIISKDSDQTHLAMAVRAYDMFDEKRYGLNLLSVVLGGNTSSRLFTEIREKLGLAYYVFSWGDQSTDCGYLGMAAGIPHEKLLDVIKKISEILSDIKKNGINKKDLDFAKGFLRGQTALRFETSDEIAFFIAGQELFYKKIMQPEEVLKKVEKVSQSDIVKIANEVFRPGNLNLAAIGQKHNDKEIKKWMKKILQ